MINLAIVEHFLLIIKKKQTFCHIALNLRALRDFVAIFSVFSFSLWHTVNQEKPNFYFKYPCLFYYVRSLLC